MPPSGNDLGGISCPTESFCVAVDRDGRAVTSTNPSGGAAAWTVARVDHRNALSAVSCPSTAFCAAVDGVGNVTTSTDPTGGAGAWNVARIDRRNTLASISCPSTTLCAAVDFFPFDTVYQGNIVTSIAPTGGASAWMARTVDQAGGLLDVSCPSDSLCAAVDDNTYILTSTRPSSNRAWKAVGTGGKLRAVSCASSTFCVAVGRSNIVFSTDPTGDFSAWTMRKLSRYPTFRDGLLEVSCPTESLCVAVDNQGDVVTSTHPRGGKKTWKSTHVAAGGAYLTDVSCASRKLCVAVGPGGKAVIGTPAQSAGASGSAP